MAQIRPLVELTYGRQNEPIRIPIQPLLQDATVTFLTNDTAATQTTFVVQNITNLATNQYLLLGQPGNQGSEIVQINGAPSGFTVTLVAATKYPHSASTPVTVLNFNQVEISNAPTVSGSKSVLATIAILADSDITYNDLVSTGGYYFARFFNSTGTVFSPYSDPCPYVAYTLLSARSVIDTALGEINKTTSEVLSDEFAFQQLDMFQTDVLRELKRWSFMQKFDAIIGQFKVGQWKLPLPDGTTLPAIDDKDTNKSIYNIRVGSNGRMTWIDKAKWDDFIFNLAYSTLSVNLTVGATTMTLVNSGDFTHITPSNTQGSGTVIIGANSYNYSANDITTGILTLTTAITSANTATAGQDVFQNANQGLPTYYTIFDNTVWYWPITSNEYDGNNAFMDYYIKQTRIQKDSDEIIVPDPQCASYFLQWKFLKKMNNGQEDNTTLIQKQNYMDRRNTLKNKEVLNRTFKNHARFQNFAIQEQSNSGDPRYIRDGAFPNTGF